MKKMIAFILALCLCVACFVAFAEEKKENEKSDAATEEKVEEKAEETVGAYNRLLKYFEQFSEREKEAFETVQMYFTIRQIFDAFDIKDNDYYKTAEKIEETLMALGVYFHKNGDKVTDPAELAKVDELKDYADMLEGKDGIDPVGLVDDALFFNSLDDDLIDQFEDLRLSDAVFETAVAADLLGDEIEDSDSIRIFKSILDYAKGIDEKNIKALIAASEAVVKDVIGTEEGKKFTLEILKLISGVPADKVEAFENEIKEAIDKLGESIDALSEALGSENSVTEEDASGSAGKAASDASDEVAPGKEEKAA